MIASPLITIVQGVPSPLRPASTTALLEARLGWTLLGIGAAVSLIVGVVVLAGLARRRGESPEEIRREGEGIRWITVGGIVLPVLILLATFALTLRALPANREGETGALRLEITGHRWWWEVRYIGQDPHDVAVTANEIHIPVGQPVRVTVTSGDVIHSFWAPQLGGKTDLIPGQPNTFMLSASKQGVYHGQCAEYCGLQHAHMALAVYADPPEQFAGWLSHQSADAEESSNQVRHGRDLFVGGACALCHTVRGTTAGGRQGPDLTHLASRRTIAAGTVPNDRGHLLSWIADPQAMKPGTLMPKVGLSGNDLTAVVDFLQTLK
jgi:cytochrome c oxidase subunit 2